MSRSSCDCKNVRACEDIRGPLRGVWFVGYITARVFSVLIMSSPKTYSLRIVVQHIREHQRSVYRLVAYGGEGGDYISRSAEFESADHLLEAFRSAIPDFDASTLSIRKDAPETYIALAEHMELNDSQLSLLGLKDGTRS